MEVRVVGGAFCITALWAIGCGTTEDATPPWNSTVIYGDVVVHNAAELAKLEGVTTIVGSLSFSGASGLLPSEIGVSTLQHVGDLLACDASLACSADAYSFPNLVTVSRLSLDGAHADFPVLISGDLSVSGFSELSFPRWTKGMIMLDSMQTTSLSLPAFSTGSLFVKDTPVASLSLPLLASGTIVLEHLPSLATISLPVYSGGDIELESVTSLAELDLPAMISVKELRVEHSAALESISIPVMTDGNLVMFANDSLSSIAAPALKSSSLYVVDNPLLSTCLIQALAMQVKTTTATISGDDDAATCP
jgi:hypothetical protein